MRRLFARLFLGVAVVVVATTMPAAPASATVHEIVAQWCSGQGELAPPGISDPAKPTFARPLIANGFIGDPVPFVGDAGPGLLINFNYEHPAGKVVGTGVFVVVGTTPAGPLYLELIEPDPSFPAFQHCPRLAG
jgi:hypothetical protein